MITGFTTVSDGNVTVNVKQEHVKGVLKGIKTTEHVLFEIVTEAREKDKEQTRLPIELALVLDTSGSMSGQKLQHAKKALAEVVDELTNDDIVHLITYDSAARTVLSGVRVTKSSRRTLRTAIAALRVGGSTNMSDGFQRALDCMGTVCDDEGSEDSGSGSSGVARKLRGWLLGKPQPTAAAPAPPPQAVQRNRRVFLFSDGHANAGVSNRDALLALVQRTFVCKEIPVTTFGVGSGYDELLMEGIADTTFGNHFFIDKPEMSSTYVGAALRGLTNLVGRKACLKVRGADGCVVEEVYGHADLVGGALVPDVKADNVKCILARCAVSCAAAGDAAAAGVPLLSFEFSYEAVSREGVASEERAVLRGELHTAVAASERDAAERSPDVVVALTAEEESKRDEQVERELLKGDVQAAIKLKEAEVCAWERTAKFDKSKKSAHNAKRAKVHLERIKKEGASKSNMMQARQNYRQKRRNSMDYMMCDAAEYSAM